MIAELAVDRLRKVCDARTMGCLTSAEMTGLETLIGQERAMRALRFGLGIQELGFNIYVAGLPGTGKATAVRQFLEDLAAEKAAPSDWCYVNDFDDPYRPRALQLPPGRGKALEEDMQRLVEAVQDEIRRAFESEEYATQRDQIVHAFEQRREELLAQVTEQAEREGFLIQVTSIGLATIPARKGKPLSEEEFVALSDKERHEISQKRDAIQGALEAAFRQTRGMESDAREAVGKLDQQIALYAISHLMEDAKTRYSNLSEVVTYLGEVQKDILQHLDEFRAEPEAEEKNVTPFLAQRDAGGPFTRYQVNVVVDNSTLTGAPVIVESNPTYGNLFGRVEQEAQFGALVTDFTMIRGGALHQANGGHLVMHVEELLPNAFSWDSLKRALANREIAIEDASERLGFMTTKSLRPEPIPLRVKVILIGRPDVYNLLRAYDEDFAELFKVKADFDTRMDRTDENVRDYAAFVCSLCEREGLKHLDSSALSRIVEHGARIAEDQEKLSTRFGEIADVIREAGYYAAQEEAQYVSAAHVQKAIDERFYRSSLIQERIQEMIARDSIKIAVAGECVGQVNGLSVIGLGDIAFGQPSRITVSLSLGREGLIDIEREAKLGGPIHTKGVLILSGYLAEKYAQDRPLSLSARLVFEQSYGGVEGDSASSTELYAMLSSLSGLPIKQGIAVTGSVNQKGEVQAIGGVNEKIEGFYAVCKAKGLTGVQGVIVPKSNVQNLMLKEEVVEAVRDGQFHVWAVKTVDEGIEILTGVQAGQRQEDGTFEEETVNKLVDERLRTMAERMKEFGRSESAKNDPSG
jgi:lon-related putative ATP-dependent protease